MSAVNDEKLGANRSYNSMDALCNFKPPSNLIVEDGEVKRIPRPRNAFLIFANENRRMFAQQFQRECNKQISQRLGTAWRRLPPETKSKFFERAAEEDKEHKQKWPNYMFIPNKRRRHKLKYKYTNQEQEFLPKDEPRVCLFKHKLKLANGPATNDDGTSLVDDIRLPTPWQVQAMMDSILFHSSSDPFLKTEPDQAEQMPSQSENTQEPPPAGGLALPPPEGALALPLLEGAIAIPSLEGALADGTNAKSVVSSTGMDDGFAGQFSYAETVTKPANVDVSFIQKQEFLMNTITAKKRRKPTQRKKKKSASVGKMQLVMRSPSTSPNLGIIQIEENGSLELQDEDIQSFPLAFPSMPYKARCQPSSKQRSARVQSMEAETMESWNVPNKIVPTPNSAHYMENTWPACMEPRAPHFCMGCPSPIVICPHVKTHHPFVHCNHGANPYTHWAKPMVGPKLKGASASIASIPSMHQTKFRGTGSKSFTTIHSAENSTACLPIQFPQQRPLIRGRNHPYQMWSQGNDGVKHSSSGMKIKHIVDKMPAMNRFERGHGESPASRVFVGLDGQSHQRNRQLLFGNGKKNSTAQDGMVGIKKATAPGLFGDNSYQSQPVSSPTHTYDGASSSLQMAQKASRAASLSNLAPTNINVPDALMVLSETALATSSNDYVGFENAMKKDK